MIKFNSLHLTLWVRIFIAQLFVMVAACNGQLAAQTTINFSSSALAGENVSNPTSLQFGPDQRLYVSQQNGTIRVYGIRKNGPNNYEVTNTETINLIRNIPNHDDDGTLNSTLITRQVTGILVVGSSSNPIIYVASSDSRIGGGGTGGDKNLDTNSGILSKLTWNGTAWEKIDIVKGLPRSEENHSSNGLTLDASTNILYIAQGGHTNAGSPSNNFAFLTEYALSAAILKIDLNAINSQFGGSYTLPTLDDPSRANSGPNGEDINDPWGGNDGLNQAKLVPGGPVQIYSTGYRNAYDVIITKTSGKAGRMYTIDNGANGGWGGYPDKEGTPQVNNAYITGEPGSTTPGLNDDKVNNLDNLHLVSAPGMPPIYGGHPNPIRANPSGAGLYIFNNTTGVGQFSLTPTSDWPPVPVSMANPVESDFRNPGVNDGALYTWPASTNGIAEYTATSFNGELAGDLLAASFDGNIYRIKLNAAGTAVVAGSVLAGGFGSQPLDIIAQGDNDIFPGTIWAATFGANSITIFEPDVPSSVWNDVAYNSSGITPPARHENGFVEVNGKFYLIGGRTERNVNIFDPVTQTWSLGAASPIELNHFQAVVYNEEIYAICAMQGIYPNEVPVTNIYKYNTRTNTWGMGAAIPVNRRRGSSGVVVYNNKFYIVAGIQNGHIDGWVPWVDEYDPATGIWTILPDAPVARDHFMATLINGKIYAAGGRQTHYPDFAANTIGNVDVYDIAAKTWSSPTQIPTQRGAPGVAYINGELVIAGGEILSSGSALTVVESYNPITNVWQTKPSLNVGRHATQMISYQGKLYLAAGSTTQGGNGQTNSMSEARYVTNCTGDTGSFNLDDDSDGYTNGDETANGTDPCSAASKPEDFDLDGLSDITDTDDDNDGLNDQTDKFALDPQNGTTTNIPIDYPFLNANPGFGLFGLGFTGLMSNNTDYKNNYDPDKPNLVMGGAVGIATAPAESGDPTTNDQKYAFQFGININQSTPPFTIRGKLLGSSFFDGASGSQLGTQSQGIYFGTGDQDTYMKLVLHANNGNPGMQILIENGGVVTYQNIFPVAGILSASAVDVFFDINPATGIVQCRYQTNSASASVNVGPMLTLTGNILTALQNNNAIAVGLIASAGNKAPFTASWDYLHIAGTAQETLTEVIRINAGGPNLQFGNELWRADQYFTGGKTFSSTSAISNTTNDALYQTERYGNMTYNIPVPQSGKYTVELHFAEINFQ
ncbi:hypothetical protein GZH53_00385, partial [Flavihumibacter sp. R14]|nr:hypothetical protein [Flavihumibacter soli]